MMVSENKLKLTGALSFVNFLRATPAEIKRETQKHFKIGIAGSESLVNALYDVITGRINLDISTEGTPHEYIELVKSTTDGEVAKLKANSVIYLLSIDDLTSQNLRAYQNIFRATPRVKLFIEEPDTMEEKERVYNLLDEHYIYDRAWIKTPITEESVAAKASKIIEITPDIDMAVAYRFPVFRPAVAERLIRHTSNQNMVVALASSLPTNIPVIGIIIGFMAVAGETTVLTINQLKMCLQLAGIYGLEIDLTERIKELWPLVGTAIGFRAMARSLIGFIPVAGPPVKGAIAYGGTYLVGETVKWYYERGRTLTSKERKIIYNESRNKAFSAVRGYLLTLRKTLGGKKAGKVDINEFEKELDNIERNIDNKEGMRLKEKEQISPTGGYDIPIKITKSTVPGFSPETSGQPREIVIDNIEIPSRGASGGIRIIVTRGNGKKLNKKNIKDKPEGQEDLPSGGQES